MIYKRAFSVVISLLLIFSLASCKADEASSVTQESTTAFDYNMNENASESVLNTDVVLSEVVSENVTQNAAQTSSAETTVATTEAITEGYDETADWSTERIIEEYKNAARKSNSTVKSSQKIELKKITLNNGEYDKFFSLVMPIISKFLESNSTEKYGVTGGFENLVPEDVSSAKAYKDGENTVIEMQMAEQVSGPKEDALSGSVGHAITAVGDISVVINDLADRGLPLELSEEDTEIHYTNADVKVVVNSNGEIVSGSWKYTVDIRMNNFKAFGKKLEKASVIMDNIITV